MKKVLMIIGAVIVAGLIAFGSFEGGMAYQRNQQNQVRNDFVRERGAANSNLQFQGGNFPVGTPGANPGQIVVGQGGGFMGAGVTGEVKSIEGNVVTITTSRSDTTVNLTDTTQIVETTPVALADLQPGQQVMVTGQRDSDGNYTAIQILILDTSPASTPTVP